jgi:hypothetical protein
MASIYESALTKAVSDLESRGYTVQRELSPSPKSPLRNNILAWGVDSNGVLCPMVAVEVHSPEKMEEKDISNSRRQLKALRDYLGTKTHFIYDGEKWLELSENFLEFNVSSGPVSMSGIESSCVTDIKSITNLIEVPFWQSVERLRNDMPVESCAHIAIEELLKNHRITDVAVYLTSHPAIGLNPDSLIKACLGLLERSLGRNSEFSTPKNVIDFLFNLISPQGFTGSFVDPFSGSGATLREFVLRSKLNNSSIGSVDGIEINSRTAEMSRLFNSLIDTSIKVITGDSITTPKELVDVSVSIPPVGIRRTSPIDTPFGPTSNGDLVALVQIAISLKPNGVAACLVAPGWTWQVSREALEFRNWLSTNFHVVALISMPAVLDSTRIKPVVLVIRNSAPGETIVGTMGDDWLEQSQPQGELFQQIQASLKI